MGLKQRKSSGSSGQVREFRRLGGAFHDASASSVREPVLCSSAYVLVKEAHLLACPRDQVAVSIDFIVRYGWAPQSGLTSRAFEFLNFSAVPRRYSTRPKGCRARLSRGFTNHLQHQFSPLGLACRFPRHALQTLIFDAFFACGHFRSGGIGPLAGGASTRLLYIQDNELFAFAPPGRKCCACLPRPAKQFCARRALATPGIPKVLPLLL